MPFLDEECPKDERLNEAASSLYRRLYDCYTHRCKEGMAVRAKRLRRSWLEFIAALEGEEK